MIQSLFEEEIPIILSCIEAPMSFYGSLILIVSSFIVDGVLADILLDKSANRFTLGKTAIDLKTSNCV
jgi:hypothetical protein